MNLDYPNKLYKRFSCKDYAESFAKGKIILKSILDYDRTYIDDPNRGEPRAGKAQVIERGMPTEISNSWNSSYVLCLSNRGVGDAVLNEKYGYHVVAINDPQKFKEALQKALPIGNWRVDFGAVSYDKGVREEDQFEFSDAQTLLPYLQKFPRDKDEGEYRFVIRKTVCLEEMNRRCNGENIESRRSIKIANSDHLFTYVAAS